MSGWTALVLAGSRPAGDAFAHQMGAELKALIPVAGEPMVRRPVRALLASPAIARVRVLAQQPGAIQAALPEDRRLTVEPSGATIAETLLALDLGWPVLVTTADHALLDEGMIAEFTGKAAGADLAIGLVEQARLLRRFPDARRTWSRFRGGAYSGANLFALGSPQALKAVELWRSVEQDRKKGWKLLLAFGVPGLLGLLRLRTVHQTLDSIGKRLGITIRAVEMSDPLACVDVDKPADHALVEAVLAGRA